MRRRERCEDGAFDGWLNRPGAVLVEPVVESRHGHLFVPSHSSADYRLRRSATASRVFDLLVVHLISRARLPLPHRQLLAVVVIWSMSSVQRFIQDTLSSFLPCTCSRASGATATSSLTAL